MAFRKLMDLFKPKYFLHGHVHLAYGHAHKRFDKYLDTQVINGYERFVFDYEDEVPSVAKYGKLPSDPKPGDIPKQINSSDEIEQIDPNIPE